MTPVRRMGGLVASILCTWLIRLSTTLGVAATCYALAAISFGYLCAVAGLFLLAWCLAVLQPDPQERGEATR